MNMTLEKELQYIWEIEVSVGLHWYGSVRDLFRHMWE